MKSVLIALLLVAVLSLLLVAAEAKRQRGKEKPAGGRRQWLKKVKECPRNCSDCEEGICRECDDDFVLRSYRFNKTTCEPCGRKLKMKEPALFLQHCVTECSKNCSSCGDNGNCEMCQDGFFKVQTRLLQRTICVRCSGKMRKNWPDVYKKECSGLHGCGRNCTNCNMDGVCTECEGELKLYTPPGSNFTKCVKKCPLFHKLVKGSSPTRCEVKQLKRRVKTSCGRNCTNCTMDGVCTECEGDLKLYAPLGINFTKCVKKCPLFYKPVKGSSPTRCEVKQLQIHVKTNCPEGCLTCTSGICSRCKQGLTLNRKSKRCVKLCSPADPDVKTRPGCEGKAKGKEGKKKRKGGKGKPNRKPTN